MATGCSSGAATSRGTDTSITTATTAPTTTSPSETEGTTEATVGPTGDGSDSDSGETTSTTDPTTGSTTVKYDVGAPDAGDTEGNACEVADHTACDLEPDDPFRAIGLNCPGEVTVAGSWQTDPVGMEVIASWGEGTTYTPREGSHFLVLSSGDLGERLDVPDSPGDAAFHCNSTHMLDGMDTSKFPAPIQAKDVGGDCLQNPALVGTGDCSNTIESQFQQSGWKYDYQELRFSTTVPEGASTLSFDVAFLTKEYPVWLDMPFNDMFIAWVESSTWSGNVSFDQNGKALSLNAAFLEYFDENGDLPQFAGTCMRYSAGTGWLTTTVAVEPGDDIEVVFAVFDLDDANWDSFVFLDNVRWGCDEIDEPETEPIG